MGFILKKPADVEGSTLPAILIGLFVAFGGVLFGYDTGTIGGIITMKYWRAHFSTGYVNPNDHFPDITTPQTSEIVSILSAGTFFGALFSAPIADHLGRRLGMIFNTLVFILGVILQTAATHIPTFVAGRFFAGLGVGLLSATIPLYQSETAPKWIRGTIVGCYQFAITIGLLIAAIVLNATKNFNNSGSYRIPVAVQFIYAIIIIVGMLLLPETPRFLIKQGRIDAAAKSLATLRRLKVDNPALVAELAEIRANHEYEVTIGEASYLACFQAPIRKRLWTGIALQALQQLTGINFIFYYGTKFFSNSGIQNPFIVTVITSVVNVCSTIPGLYLVETWGRRNLLLFGAVGMCISQFIVAAVGTALPHELAANKALIAFVCFYIFFFACSWGPCAWVVTGEIFPLKARARGLSMTTASNWLLNCIIGIITPYMVDAPGELKARVFFIWGSFCFICTAFVYFFIYETKGFSLESVDELYAKVPHAWKSKGFVPTVNFTDIKDLNTSDVRRHTLADLELQADNKRNASVAVDTEFVKSM